jgi:diacylglycerol kinase (ATP)
VTKSALAPRPRPDAAVGALELLPPRLFDWRPRRQPVRVAVISNPTAGQNARRGLLARIDDVLTSHPSVPHRLETTYAGIADAARAAVADEAEIIVVNGGDGTAQAVLTTIFTTPAKRLPVLAVLPGGTTNSTARNVGYGTRALPALQRLLAASAEGSVAGSVTTHPVMRIDLDAGPQYAMMFGIGGVYNGVKFVREQLASRGMRGEVGGIVALATFLAKAITGKGGALFPPLTAAVQVDGVPLPATPYFGILTSTINRQILGMRPYWGVGPGPLRFSAMSYRPTHLTRALVPALRGRPSPWLHPDFGYRSLNADEVVLLSSAGFTIDGELHPATARDRRVAISARHPAYFLRAQP